MFSKILIPTLSAGLISGAVLAEETPIKSIDVTADIAVIENAEAAKFWGNLETDLEAAIAAEIAPDRLVGAKGEGSEITVDIDEIALSDTWATVTDLGESRLVGQVNVTSQTDNSKFDGYELSVAFKDALVFLPEGADVTLLTRDSAEYYAAMLQAFAEHVVDRLK
ncbi:hypothetical protein [Pontitalea aquivivens]|uniref:hypothetical protein n=1 Tax=Pontitalea aquivivens TaxID=3388663 RepID=UPI0039704890